MIVSDYKIGLKIEVKDKIQSNYSYLLSKNYGEEAADFHQYGFFPELNPGKILELGVFEGKYLNDCEKEFPEEWFAKSKLKRSSDSDINKNFFKAKSRLSLREWKRKKWIIGDDPRGWFQWYFRYYIGRRTNYDVVQIKRWKSFKRHKGQISVNCPKNDLNCRPKQRQALLQWAYNPFF